MAEMSPLGQVAQIILPAQHGDPHLDPGNVLLPSVPQRQTGASPYGVLWRMGRRQNSPEFSFKGRENVWGFKFQVTGTVFWKGHKEILPASQFLLHRIPGTCKCPFPPLPCLAEVLARICAQLWSGDASWAGCKHRALNDWFYLESFKSTYFPTVLVVLIY